MLGIAGLWRAVLQRARVDWPVLFAAWLLLLCATTLLSAAALYGDTVALGGIRRSIETAAAPDRTLAVRISADPTLAAQLDGPVRDELGRSIQETGGEVALVARSGALDFRDRAAADVQEGALLASHENIAAHADLVAGAWPAAGGSPVETAIADGAAAALGVAVGDELALEGSLDETLGAELRVVGIWRAHPDDPYWLGDPLELGGVELRGAFRLHGPFVVERADLEAVVGSRRLDLQWRAIPAVGNLDADGVDVLRDDVASLRQRLGAALPPRTDFTIQTDLRAILEDVGRSTLVSRSGVLVLTIQFAVLAGYAILLVAGMLLDRRRPETALLRSRGATTGHLILMALAEAVLLALPAALLAPFLAVGIVLLLGTLGPLRDGAVVAGAGITNDTLVVTAATALACVVALTLPTVLSGMSPGRVRAAIGRGLDRTLGQRLGLDLALLVLAGVALWQLQLYGAPLTRNARGVLGADPLLVAAPAIGLLAGALVATRIIPRSAELAEKVFERRRGFVGPLGARQLARRPLRYTRSALLLMLAAALGTFAAAYGATWTRSQVDRAAYETVTDIRVLTGAYGRLPAFAVGEAYRATPGVETATPVVRRSVSVGRAIRDATLLAFDARAVPERATLLGETDDATLRPLLAGLVEQRPSAGQPLPPGTSSVALTIDAAFEAADLGDPFPEAEMPPGWEGIVPAVTVIDGDGRIHRFAGTVRGTFDGAGQRLEIPLGATIEGIPRPATEPLTLLAVEFELSPPPNTPVIGAIDLRSVEAGGAAAWTPVPWTERDLELEQIRADIGTFSGVREVSPGSSRLEIDPRHATVSFTGGGPSVILQLRATTQERGIGAIVSESFAEASGVVAGDDLRITVLGRPVVVHVDGIVPSVAPLDPAEPFVVVDAPTYQLVSFLETGEEEAAAEWWLTAADAAVPGVLAALRQPPNEPDDVIGRAELADQLAGDPVALGVIGAFGLGSLAALAFAAIGFVVSATASVTERLGEFALLQAVGLSARQLSTWVSLENAFLLLFGLITGSALGLLLSWLVLPFATLTESGATPVPTPVVEIPWLALIPLYALAGIVLFVTLVVITSRVPRTHLSSVLRARDE